MELIRRGRREPYTEIGVRRLPCVRCGQKSLFQWSACADGNLWRPVCLQCDVDLNALVLKFMRDPDAEEKVSNYALVKLNSAIQPGDAGDVLDSCG